jgi:hypothetical protein
LCYEYLIDDGTDGNTEHISRVFKVFTIEMLRVLGAPIREASKGLTNLIQCNGYERGIGRFKDGGCYVVLLGKKGRIMGSNVISLKCWCYYWYITV